MANTFPGCFQNQTIDWQYKVEGFLLLVL